MSFDCRVFVSCRVCTCALFVGGRCEGGALEVADILLELRQCFGAGEACVSGGAGWRTWDL
jgi:hypothetical protein